MAGGNLSLWRRAAIALVGLVLAIAIGIWLGSLPARSLGPMDVYADERSLDFGEVWEQRKLDWRISLHNRSADPVTVSNVVSSCGCTSIEPRSFVIAPKGSQELRLTIDLVQGLPTDAALRRVGIREAAKIEDFSVTFAAHLESSSQRTASWLLRGRVRRHPVKPSRPFAHFSEPQRRGVPFAPQAVELTSRIPLQSLHAESDPAGMAEVVVREENSGVDTRTLLITPSAALPRGPFSFAIRVSPISDKGERLPDLIIPVMGEIQSLVQVIPHRVVFASSAVGSWQEQTVTFRARDGRAFRIVDVRPSGDDIYLEASPAPAQAVSEFTLRAHQFIAKSGSQRASLEVDFEFADMGDHETVIINVFYMGITANGAN